MKDLPITYMIILSCLVASLVINIILLNQRNKARKALLDCAEYLEEDDTESGPVSKAGDLTEEEKQLMKGYYNSMPPQD